MEYFTASKKKISAFLTAPLIDDDGELIGVFAVELNLDNIFSLFGSRMGYSSFLIGTDNLLRTDISDKKKALEFKIDLKIFNSKTTKQMSNYKNIFDKEVLGVSDIINIYDVQWKIVNEVEHSVIFESEKEFALSLIAFLFLISILVFVVARYFSLQITKPINKLVKISKDISKSDKNTMDNSAYGDEVDQLTYAFNEMVDSLSKNENLLIKKSKELSASKEKLQQYAYELEDKIAEEVRKNSLQQQTLFNQTRLAQMGEMISMIAHQWRQPLGAISATAMDLQMKIELESFDLETKAGREEYVKYFLSGIKNIDEFVQNLTTTIEDFRSFYKSNKKLVSLTLAELIMKSLNVIKASLLNANIEIIEEYRSNDVIELYDSEMMHVILNILKNAQDNFKEKEIKNPKIIIAVDKKKVSICDNGGGISNEVVDKIFDPYFSTKDEKNGTGLGLYMSKTIVEEHHNGKLYVENINDGACFFIEIGENI